MSDSKSETLSDYSNEEEEKKKEPVESGTG